MTDPSCGYTCVVQTANRYLETCDYNVPCVCRSEDYFNAVYSCISSVCSAADIQAWNQIAENDCEAYGATFPTFPVSAPASTAIVAASTAPPGPASTVAVTSFAPTTIISTAVVVAGSTVTTAGPASQTNFFGAPVTSSSALPPGASSQSTPPPTSQSTSSGSSSLSTGAIVGIALGAVGVILLALIAGILFWRRSRRSQSGARRDGGGTPPHDGGELAVKPQGDPDKEATYTTVTGVGTTTGPPPPKEPAISDPRYITPNSASELPGKEKTALATSPQPVSSSPTPAYSQPGAPLPPEIDTAPYRQTAYSPPPPQHGAAEVDSRTVNPPHPPVQQQQPPISELGPPESSTSTTTYYELPTSIGPATWAPPSGTG